MTKVIKGRTKESMAVGFTGGQEKPFYMNGELGHYGISNFFSYNNKIDGKEAEFKKTRQAENIFDGMTEEEFAKSAVRNVIAVGFNPGNTSKLTAENLKDFFRGGRDYNLGKLYNHRSMCQLRGMHMTDIIKFREIAEDGHYVMYADPKSENLSGVVAMAKNIGDEAYANEVEMGILNMNFEIFAKECLTVNGTQDEVIYLLALGTDVQNILKGFIKWANLNGLSNRFELVAQELPHYSGASSHFPRLMEERVPQIEAILGIDE